MQSFARLFIELDASTATRAKVDALRRYLAQAAPRDAAWAVYFLAGGKPRQTVGSRALREFALQASGLPDWLLEESYQAVGDLAETIALLLPPPARQGSASLADWVEDRLLPLRGLAPAEVIARLRDYVDALDATGRLLLIKLIGGGFRVGVSRLLVTRALAEYAGLDPKLVAQRMVGYTDTRATPTAERFLALLAHDAAAPDDARPWPFFLAHPLAVTADGFDAALGPPADWLVEWKYDGIRAQLVRRGGQVTLWSRGEDLISDRFPELVAAGARLPEGTVLDGEVLVWDAARDRPASFAQLQRRITRRNVGAKLLRELPAVLIAYDALQAEGRDLRDMPQRARRAVLESLVTPADQPLRLSPLVDAPSWLAYAALRAEARERGVEGLMLKHAAAAYRSGRVKAPLGAHWWKWKIDPYAVDAVLVYAQAGHGRRASLYTDYTFAVWDERDGVRVLVPFAKAYSGLTDEEIRVVDAIVRRTTREKFGPVRSLEPTQVFELGFEGIQASPRHKSGIAVRFPRMLRWRRDKAVDEADTLATLQALLAAASADGAGLRASGPAPPAPPDA